jgi:hypothetical protein
MARKEEIPMMSFEKFVFPLCDNMEFIDLKAVRTEFELVRVKGRVDGDLDVILFVGIVEQEIFDVTADRTASDKNRIRKSQGLLVVVKVVFWQSHGGSQGW